MPGGEIFFYIFLGMVIAAVVGVILFLCGVWWAFSESPSARYAYVIALVLIVWAHIALLRASGLQGWAITWRVEPVFPTLVVLLTIWIVAGVPFVRWIRHRALLT